MKDRYRKCVLIVVIVWAVVSLAALSWAEPYLVCDPQSDADGYIYKLNGGPEVTVPYVTAVFSGQTYAVIADLATLPVGPFAYEVWSYKGPWRSVLSSPFLESKPSVGSPSNPAIAR